MKKIPKIFEITFSSSHSIILGHKPTQVCADGLCKNIATVLTEDSLASFGLFGGSSDPNKFYPDLASSNWAPAEGDFIQPVFRGLSETTVIFQGMPISFAKPGVLKASLALVKGITINTNHDTEVENAIGAVVNAHWQGSYSVGKHTIPAGINLVLKIDAKSNPRIARAITMEPPAIHSNSMTVRFNWEQSHTDLSDDDFFSRLGSYGKDGELIQLVVTKIKSYSETSLVAHGADPYAQVMDGKSILDPEHASSVYNFSLDNSFNNNTKTSIMEMKEILLALGLDPEKYKDMEAIKLHVGNLESNQVPEGVIIEDLQTASTELTALKDVYPEITPELVTTLQSNQLEDGKEIVTEEQTTILTAVADLGGMEVVSASIASTQEFLATIRLEAANAYKLTKGDKAQADIITLIEGANMKTATALRDEHVGNLEEQVPLTCISCGSTEVSRATANSKKEATHSYKDDVKVFHSKHGRKPSSMHPSE